MNDLNQIMIGILKEVLVETEKYGIDYDNPHLPVFIVESEKLKIVIKLIEKDET